MLDSVTNPVTRSLRSSETLAQSFDVALLDLDGVVYVGKEAVPGASAALQAARDLGMRLAFVTNNAARPPGTVAAHLTELGIAAEPEDVTTSSQAAAHYLSDLVPDGSAVLVIGTTGLIEALEERGLRPVYSADDEPVAVVQGYSPDLNWQQLAEGAIAIRRGLPWVATNLDPTVPSPRGALPGNGSVVAALRHATGVVPIATGKPDPTMHRESVQRSRALRPIVVGDRLDTDIEGAAAVGCASLLVFSGVTAPADLLVAPPEHRPDFIAHDVSGLLYSHQAPRLENGIARCGPWQVSFKAGACLLASVDADRSTDAAPSSEGEQQPALEVPAGSAGDGLDALRALCAAVWQSDARADVTPDFRAADERAAGELRRLSLIAS